MIRWPYGGRGYVYFMCRDKPRGCPYMDARLVGRTVWHSHQPALFRARRINQRARRKVVKVIVQDHHFWIVETNA